MSAISEVNNFLSRKAWIPINKIKVKYKGRETVHVKWKFKSKEYSDGLFRLKSIHVVKGYLQFP